MKPRIKGLYAVTPDLAETPRLLMLVGAALQGGAAIIQYRNKSASPTLRHAQAHALLALCRKAGVPLIINDHVDLCATLGADGVHLGGEDGDIAAARNRLGQNCLIGTSCYNRLELAVAARQQGADYVAFGSCFGSGTKPAAVRAPLSLLGEARQRTHLPVVAIGGITQDNASAAINAGADAIAVIGALWSADDVEARARALSNLFTISTP